MTPVLRLDNARFGYNGTIAARADLQVDQGEVVAIIGSNGSGKSTLLNGTVGLVDRYGGSVEWFGRALETLRERWRIGYVPQHALAASPVPATVEEVVSAGRRSRRGLLRRFDDDDRNAVLNAIYAVGLADRRRSPTRELSGGQQRRTLIARALAGEPDVLLLDEPLASVDPAHQSALATIVGRLAAAGTTVITVVHDLGPLATAITRTVRISGGAIVDDRPAAHQISPTDGGLDECGGGTRVPRFAAPPVRRPSR